MNPGDFVLSFGKFSGQRLSDVPLDYVVYLATDLKVYGFSRKTERARMASRNAAQRYLRRRWSCDHVGKGGIRIVSETTLG